MNKELQQIIDELAKTPKKEQKSGVELKGFNDLKFPDHLWAQNPVHESHIVIGESDFLEWRYSREELLSLVSMIVKVGDVDQYFLKNQFGLKWECYGASKRSIYEKLHNDYQLYKYESIFDPTVVYTCDLNKIALLVYGTGHKVISEGESLKEIEVSMGTIPSVYRAVSYPLQNEYLISHEGEMMLNLGASYTTLKGKFSFDKISKFLRMIYRALCNYPALKDANGEELSDEEERLVLFMKVMMNEFLPEDKDFKFVLSWCAAIVQRPGINLMTNIWFSGEYQGIGKGTLVNFLKAILGKDKVGRCKANMILGSFNAELFGKLVLEINEKQQGVTPLEMTNWLKGFSQEDDVQIEKKGYDPITTINTINVIGTAQTPEDVFKIEDEDRRNVIFRTVVKDSDPTLYWRKYAKEIATGLKENDDWGRAVAWLLERIDVDWDLLSTSYQTRGYAEVKSTQMAAQNPLYFWALDSFVEYAAKGSRISAKVLYEEFKDEVPTSTIRTQSGFNKKLKELVGLEELPEFELIIPNNVLTAVF